MGMNGIMGLDGSAAMGEGEDKGADEGAVLMREGERAGEGEMGRESERDGGREREGEGEGERGEEEGGDTELDAEIFGYPAAAEAFPEGGSAFPDGLAVDMHATATILLLRQAGQEKDAKIAALQAELQGAKDEIQKWSNAVLDTGLIPRNAPCKPEAVGPAMERLKSRHTHLADLLMGGQRRETVLHVRLTGIQDSLAKTRAQLYDCAVTATPVNLQTQRLLLDPVINAQYAQIKSMTDALEKRVKELQDDLAAVQFTPHSKNGKMLMAKCRTLQEENEEIGREASEGRMHDLENKLALQKQLNVELKRGYQELQDYIGETNAETERLQDTVYKLQRQLQLREQEVQELSNKLAREPTAANEAPREPPHPQQRDAPHMGGQRDGDRPPMLARDGDRPPMLARDGDRPPMLARDGSQMPEGRPPLHYQERGWDGPIDRERGRDPRRREGKRMRPERTRPRDDDGYDYR